MAARKFALILLDGLSDQADPSGRTRTPLETARTPNLDRLATEGSLGAVEIIGPGVAPESDAGVLALLGYDPVRDSPGRGVLEALGSEVALAPGDVAFRLNFATLAPDGSVADARVGRSLSTEESRELADAIDRADLVADLGVEAIVRPTVGHRGVLRLHPREGAPLSGAVSNSDPFYEKVGGMGRARAVTSPRPLPVQALGADPAAERTALVANRFLERVAPLLAHHPRNAARAAQGKPVANGLLLRNAGGVPPHPPPAFAERHGLAGTAVTEMPVERGIARYFGLADVFVGPMGPDRTAALAERARLTRQALDATPFVYVHLKGPDEPGHDGDARRKQEIIEALDEGFFGPFLQGLSDPAIRVAVTADHSTPAARRGHSDDPVPLLLWGPGVPAGPEPVKFGETESQRGALGRRPAREVLPLLFGRLALRPRA